MSERGRDVVEVWRLPLARSLVELHDRLRALSAAERDRAARFASERDRADWVTVRSTLRNLLGARLGLGATDVRLEALPGGKPVLAGGASLRFSVSHTAGLALIALADGREVGVDVEAWRPPSAQVRDKVLAAGEQDRVSGAPDPVAAFYDHWALKEAYLKCTGQGLSGGPSTVVVTPGIPTRIGTIVVRSLDVETGYSAGLAVECTEGTEPPAVALRTMGGASLAAASV